MRRRRYLATVAAGAGAGLAGCLGGGPGPSDDFDVGMGATVFEPRELRVAVGEAVRWKNTNSRAHTVTAYQSRRPADADYFATGGFDTEQAARDAFYERLDGAVTTGEAFEHTFEVPGDHHYFCVPHERSGMVGVVVVEG